MDTGGAGPEPPKGRAERWREVLTSRAVHAIVFADPGEVRGLAGALSAEARSALQSMRLVAVGQTLIASRAATTMACSRPWKGRALDLEGTKLVVLSACETGIGPTPYGEGVYGLRRALVLAGTESQVMSLWPVDDDTTRDLMVAFYRRLGRGEGRAEALRLAQREIAATPGRAHPFFWASFIPIGAWGPLE